jgi:CRISPR-associated endonuclease/helicase Cas3
MIHRLLWAKTDKATSQEHELIYHLIDVGNAALNLWQTVLPDSLKSYFSNLLEVDTERAGRLLAFWISLHDLGKASPAFQGKYPAALPRLKQAGYIFPDPGHFLPAPHGLVTTWALEPLLIEWGMPKRPAKMVCRALGGHHGTWPNSGELLGANKRDNLGSGNWESARQSLYQELLRTFNPPASFSFPTALRDQNSFLALFSGYTTIADWLGSMQEYFPFEPAGAKLESYARRSHQRASHAIQQTGWRGWRPDQEVSSFEKTFEFAPNLTQQAVVQAGKDYPNARLVILEAPTGSGKTEAALYLSGKWLQERSGRGMYIAMPTQATSNQMFARTCRYLHKRYPQELVNIQLAHGQALWSDNLKEIILSQIGEDAEGRIAAMRWFLPSKRTLLAPFGVGTVDQSFLAVLQTRHFFVRLFGLANKVVIFDEVHAYDTYMSELFWQLLGWLKAVNASVIILSATLPRNTRQKLVQAFTGRNDAAEMAAAFPRVTVVSDEETAEIGFESDRHRSVAIEHASNDPQAIQAILEDRLSDGGCAAVICNTVRRAQELYEALKPGGLVAPQDLILFHARFPYAWRMEKEKQVLERFSKTGDRPHKSLVIATQVIEQSLDLDFDLILTELAPVDLVVQRIGRLHRHNRAARPARISQPTLVLLDPPTNEDGLPVFGSDRYVYERYILLRSYLCLKERQALALPADTDELIEIVYGDRQLEVQSPRVEAEINKSRKEMLQADDKAFVEAQLRLVRAADDEDFLTANSLGLKEDAKDVHESLRALTRLAEPGVSLVCLHQTPDGRLVLDPDDPRRGIDLAIKPDPKIQQALLQSSIHVQHRALVEYFAQQPLLPAWKEVPALQEHHPLIFTEGRCALPEIRHTLTLNRELGLQIEKEAQ